MSNSLQVGPSWLGELCGVGCKDNNTVKNISVFIKQHLFIQATLEGNKLSQGSNNENIKQTLNIWFKIVKEYNMEGDIGLAYLVSFYLHSCLSLIIVLGK